MLIVLTPGGGKTHYHDLRRGIDLETVLVTCFRYVVIGHVGYLTATTGNDDYYTTLCAAGIRALNVRYPGSLDPEGGSADSVDILINSIYLPSEIPPSQCHLLVPAESVVTADLASRGDPKIDGFLKLYHDTLKQASSFATARVDMSREALDKASETWRAGPKMREEDIVWLRERIIEDQKLIDLYGQPKLKEMAKVASTSGFHMHAPENVRTGGYEEHLRGV